MLRAGETLPDQILGCSPSAMVTIKQIVRTPVGLEMASTQRLASLGRIDSFVRPVDSRAANWWSIRAACQSGQEPL